ncbi:MAG: 2,4'-dihydroxyacetophenone dioxygenase family protein [Pseudomonadota bacterium]
MSVTQLSTAKSSVTSTAQAKPAFFNPETLEWIPWVMEGTHFKLFAVDAKTGGFTMLLRVDPGVKAPVHGHVGAVEGIVTKGWFAYGEHERGDVGHYICESGGVRHEPVSPEGTEMFAIAHGPIVGYNPDGSIAAVVDAKMLLAMAREAGQADHIDVVFDD